MTKQRLTLLSATGSIGNRVLDLEDILNADRRAREIDAAAVLQSHTRA